MMKIGRYIGTLTALATMIITLNGCATDDILSRFHYQDEKIDGFTKHYVESVFHITERRLFSVEFLLSDSNLRVGANRFYLIVHDSEDRDVAKADLTVIASHAEAGSPAKARIIEEGQGLYRVTGLTLDRTGKWEITIKVTKDGKSDTALFSFSGVSMKPRIAK